mmetsp:Transcript_85315/g.241691  ORF Transcript_85315/g.241691 Transcript_85315/m.241691 type:complete len:214 (-) Transcript_85315:1333-1974(-)
MATHLNKRGHEDKLLQLADRALLPLLHARLEKRRGTALQRTTRVVKVVGDRRMCHLVAHEKVVEKHTELPGGAHHRQVDLVDRALAHASGERLRRVLVIVHAEDIHARPAGCGGGRALLCAAVDTPLSSPQPSAPAPSLARAAAFTTTARAVCATPGLLWRLACMFHVKCVTRAVGCRSPLHGGVVRVGCRPAKIPRTSLPPLASRRAIAIMV